MLLAVLVLWTGIWQKLLFQINQSEESSKITVNAHTTSCPLHQLPNTTASTLIILLHLNLFCLTFSPFPHRDAEVRLGALQAQQLARGVEADGAEHERCSLPDTGI